VTAHQRRDLEGRGPRGAQRAQEELALDGRPGRAIRRGTQQWLQDVAACTFILAELEADPLGAFADEFLAYLPQDSERKRRKMAAEWAATMRAWLAAWRRGPDTRKWHTGAPR